MKKFKYKDPWADAINELETEIDSLRELLADAYVKLSGKKIHSNTCATSCAPARTPKECDCAEIQEINLALRVIKL